MRIAEVWPQCQWNNLHLQWLKECDDFYIVELDSVVKRCNFRFNGQIPVYIPDETTICCECISAI
jgi:hypothetical protein